MVYFESNCNKQSEVESSRTHFEVPDLEDQVFGPWPQSLQVQENALFSAEDGTIYRFVESGPRS